MKRIPLVSLLTALFITSCGTEYATPSKVDDYLYEITYSDYDFEKLSRTADLLFRNKGRARSASCSAVRKDTLFGRNFDWLYDEMPEFVIHTEAAPGRYASVGVASPIGVLKESGINRLRGKLMLQLLPVSTVDGVNEKGVACCVNVVPPGDCGYTVGTNPSEKSLCSALIVRYVLDRAGSASEAVELLKNRNIYTTLAHKLIEEYHFMISDAENTYVIEFVENAMLVLDGEKIMTNYYLSHPDTPHGMGHERYDILRAGYDSVACLDDMEDLMESVWYSGIYDETRNPVWLSDHCSPLSSAGLTVTDITDNPDKFEAVFKKKAERYRNRSRDMKESVYHSVHTSVYDIKNKVLVVSSQESGRRHVCRISSSQTP